MSELGPYGAIQVLSKVQENHSFITINIFIGKESY
jgi:hypothetical protein